MIFIVACLKVVVVESPRLHGPDQPKPFEVQSEKFSWCFRADPFFVANGSQIRPYDNDLYVNSINTVFGYDEAELRDDMIVYAENAKVGYDEAELRDDMIVYAENAKELRSVLADQSRQRYTEAPSTAQSIPESAAEGNADKAKPGKFTDSVYETYESAPSFREGAKAFAEDALDAAKAKLDERIEKAEKVGDTASCKWVTDSTL